MEVDLNKYKEFVEGVTSQQSNETESLCNQLQSLEQSGVNMALLLTGSIGIASEGGEFSEIVKNVFSKASHWTLIHSFTSSESWVISCGIGSIHAELWDSTPTK